MTRSRVWIRVATPLFIAAVVFPWAWLGFDALDRDEAGGPAAGSDPGPFGLPAEAGAGPAASTSRPGGAGTPAPDGTRRSAGTTGADSGEVVIPAPDPGANPRAPRNAPTTRPTRTTGPVEVPPSTEVVTNKPPLPPVRDALVGALCEDPGRAGFTAVGILVVVCATAPDDDQLRWRLV